MPYCIKYQQINGVSFSRGLRLSVFFLLKRSEKKFTHMVGRNTHTILIAIFATIQPIAPFLKMPLIHTQRIPHLAKSDKEKCQ